MLISDLQAVHENVSSTQEDKVKASVGFLTEFVSTYSYGACLNGKGDVFVEDMLYGLGIALNPTNANALDFCRFKEQLIDHLVDGKRVYFQGESKYEHTN